MNTIIESLAFIACGMIAPFILLFALHGLKVFPIVSFGPLKSANGNNNAFRIKMRETLQSPIMEAVLAQELYESRAKALNPILVLRLIFKSKKAYRNLEIMGHEVEVQAWGFLTGASREEIDEYRFREASILASSTSYIGFEKMTENQIANEMRYVSAKAAKYWLRNQSWIERKVLSV